MKRPVGQHFLHDASVGVDLIARPTSFNYYPCNGNFSTLYRFDNTLAITLRLYFVR